MQNLTAHCRNVAFYAVKVLGDDVKLFMAGFLHDVGKIKVPESILGKNGPLTKSEFQIVKKHTEEGAVLLKGMGYSDEIVEAVLYHHERWDGNGYPHGLKGENIPVFSRVLAVVDAFDAMTSDRPYRKALSIDSALREIEVNAGTQFDPGMVEIFINEMRFEPGHRRDDLYSG